MTTSLTMAKCRIQFPIFLPVITFGGKFSLDEIISPYLDRFCQAIMVSHFYARKMPPQNLPVFIDSGGFASLFKGSQTIRLPGGTYGIQSREGTRITPESVLSFQQEHADMAATLDFIVTPDTPDDEALQRQNWTIANAKWALLHQGEKRLKLLASLQAWDRTSMYRILEALLPHAFDGFALGGMVPRIRKPSTIFELVKAFREMEPRRPLHLFGVGTPRLVKSLFAYGVSSVDSSNYIRQTISKRYLLPSTGQYIQIDENLDPASACPCRICQQFSRSYLLLEGELNNLALSLHNLSATLAYLKNGANHGG